MTKDSEQIEKPNTCDYICVIFFISLTFLEIIFSRNIFFITFIILLTILVLIIFINKYFKKRKRNREVND